jgi:glycosyltransferase involved in cell wall biosynthesis
MRIAFDWGVSSFFGWGVYGLNLALEWADSDAATLMPVKRADLAVDALRLRRLEPFLKRSAVARVSPPAAGEVRIAALGNDCTAAPQRYQRARVGVIFFEQPLSRDAIERARRYDTIVAGSVWNAEVLRGYGLDCVELVFQGVDRSLFHPAPRRGLFPDRYVIFSGGKAEPRKGQDLVVKAFRIFAAKYPEAMLVTAWHSPWPQLAQGMDLDLSEFAEGTRPRVVDVGAVPNGAMAPIYRECDVALFPNRAEGGTNLVAMEAIACDVPAIVSHNTGHRDLIGLPGVLPLERQRQVAGAWEEWGESDVDEIVAALETARRVRALHSQRLRAPVDHRLFRWRDAAAQLAAIARSVTSQRSTHVQNECAAQAQV